MRMEFRYVLTHSKYKICKFDKKVFRQKKALFRNEKHV